MIIFISLNNRYLHCWPLLQGCGSPCNLPASVQGRCVGSEPGCGTLFSGVTRVPPSVHTHSSLWTNLWGYLPGLGTSWRVSLVRRTRMCGCGWGYWLGCFLWQKQNESSPAQRGYCFNSPGIPSDWTEGPSHGSGAGATADSNDVWILGTMSWGLKCVICSR